MLIRVWKAVKDHLAGKYQPQYAPPPLPRWAKGAGFTLKVAGTSHRQDALDFIAGGKEEDGFNLPVFATLALDPGAGGDPAAVRVEIQGEIVGYVPKSAAKEIGRALTALNNSGAVECYAKIVGGWDRGRSDWGSYGVRLNLSAPARLETE